MPCPYGANVASAGEETCARSLRAIIIQAVAN